MELLWEPTEDELSQIIIQYDFHKIQHHLDVHLGLGQTLEEICKPAKMSPGFLLQLASALELIDTVKLLLKNGCVPTDMALLEATVRGFTSVVKLLLDYGADPERLIPLSIDDNTFLLMGVILPNQQGRGTFHERELIGEDGFPYNYEYRGTLRELCGNTETYTLLVDYSIGFPETLQYVPVNPRRLQIVV